MWSGIFAALILITWAMVAPSGQSASARREATIRAVGDIMTHEDMINHARGADGKYNFSRSYKLIAASLGSADYTIANLETTVGRVGKAPYSGYPRFNSPPAFLTPLRKAGVDMLTLSNNHILDRGFEGLVKTVAEVEKAGFAHAGAYRTQKERDRPVVVDIKGIAVGFLTYTSHTNATLTGQHKPAMNYCVDKLGGADYKADVAAARKAGAEVVLAVVHWGAEYERQPTDTVKSTAKKLAQAGVDAIIGSHPHVLQPITRISVGSGKDKRSVLVAYSLGNFIAGMKGKYTDTGIILQFTLRERASGGFEVRDARYVPTYIWRKAAGKNKLFARVVPIGKYRDKRPKGMSKATHRAMNRAYKETVKLIGKKVAKPMKR